MKYLYGEEKMLWRQRSRVTTIREGEQITICIFNEKQHVDKGKIRLGKLKDAEGIGFRKRRRLRKWQQNFFKKIIRN